MTKLQYLLHATASRTVADFSHWVLADLAPRLLEKRPSRLKVTLTSEEPPRLSIMPYRKDRLALISIWDTGEAGEAVSRWNEVLRYFGSWAGYRVSETLPRSYQRDWSDGTKTPGVGMLTLFRRKPGLSDQDFIRRWHFGHTPLALRVHPLWNYVRNVVEAKAVEGSPELGGIVEEQFRTPRELLNPVVLFGGVRRMVPNMGRILFDVRGFLDLSTLENYLVSEHWLRS